MPQHLEGRRPLIAKKGTFLTKSFLLRQLTSITSFHSNMSRREQVLDCVKNAQFRRFSEVEDKVPGVTIQQVQSCSPYKTLKQVMVFFRSGLTRQLYAATVQDRRREKYVFRMQVHPRGTSHSSHDVRVLWYRGKIEIAYCDCAMGYPPLMSMS